MDFRALPLERLRAMADDPKNEGLRPVLLRRIADVEGAPLPRLFPSSMPALGPAAEPKAAATAAVPSEHDIQVEVIRWAKANVEAFPELALLHAIPNFARMAHAGKNAFRREEGMEPGVPDLHLPVARGGWFSLYIEMKRLRPRATKTKGVVLEPTRCTPDQQRWHGMLAAHGNRVAVCYTANEAVKLLRDYLTQEGSRNG
ncbi:MAG: VRR-NUC domain-containing protein [Gemmatimonadetes bacterium]|nr:VRR-NUC domain-containing protein [Gemmatimonadota bacterium]